MKHADGSDTVLEMAPPPANRRRARRRRRRARLSGRATVAILFVLALAVIFSLAAFGSSSPSFQSSLPKGASRLLASGRPLSQVIATQGALQIHMPIAQDAVSAIGYHAAGEDALPLTPVGHQANEGVVTRLFHRIFGGGGGGIVYYQLGGGPGPTTGALDVGAAAGTDVYAPVDGTVVAIDKLIVDGRAFGNTLEIQPSDAPSVVLLVSRLRIDPSLVVGSRVTRVTAKIGTVVDLSTVEKQALAKYTQDAGNHVTLEVVPATTSSLG